MFAINVVWKAYHDSDENVWYFNEQLSMKDLPYH